MNDIRNTQMGLDRQKMSHLEKFASSNILEMLLGAEDVTAIKVRAGKNAPELKRTPQLTWRDQ